MRERLTRRGFLLAALAGAGALGLALLRLGRRAALQTARRFRIPVKPFDPDRLADPHDLAG